MIFDNTTICSDQQAITATAVSTNVIDLGPIRSSLTRDIGQGEDIPFLIQVTEDFNNLTSLKVEVQTSNDEAFGSGVTTIFEKTAPLALLKRGYKFNNDDIEPGVLGRYLRVNYTVTGTAPSTGKITAGVTMGVPYGG